MRCPPILPPCRPCSIDRSRAERETSAEPGAISAVARPSRHEKREIDDGFRKRRVALAARRSAADHHHSCAVHASLGWLSRAVVSAASYVSSIPSVDAKNEPVSATRCTPRGRIRYLRKCSGRSFVVFAGVNSARQAGLIWASLDTRQASIFDTNGISDEQNRKASPSQADRSCAVPCACAAEPQAMSAVTAPNAASFRK